VHTDNGTAATRRGLIASALMIAGVAAGYGMGALNFFRYLVPLRRSDYRELFIGTLDTLPIGATRTVRDPRGREIMVARTGDDREHPERGFRALSSKCPHLGCRVHWEVAMDCFYCPCHQGKFDTDGIAFAGPPAREGQNLTQFEVRVDRTQRWVFVRIPEATGYGV
jgi:nitrite reductase/ring-hydroxylating ferredoxin subunit